MIVYSVLFKQSGNVWKLRNWPDSVRAQAENLFFTVLAELLCVRWAEAKSQLDRAGFVAVSVYEFRASYHHDDVLHLNAGPESAGRIRGQRGREKHARTITA